MVTRKAILYLALLVMIALVAACQSRSDQNRKIAEEAGLPDGAWEHLETVVLSGSGFELQSVQEATNLEPFYTSERFSSYFSGVEEIWCAVLKADGEASIFLVLNRKHTEWGGLMLFAPQEKEENAQIGQSAGCTNWQGD